MKNSNTKCLRQNVGSVQLVIYCHKLNSCYYHAKGKRALGWFSEILSPSTDISIIQLICKSVRLIAHERDVLPARPRANFGAFLAEPSGKVRSEEQIGGWPRLLLNDNEFRCFSYFVACYKYRPINETWPEKAHQINWLLLVIPA